jgi:hypothetical protein
MTRFVLAMLFAIAMMLTCAPRAEARIFEPQHDWWHSGRTCIESRTPGGLDWDGSPPRACAERNIAAEQNPRTDYALALKNELWTIAFDAQDRSKASVKRGAPRSEVFAQPIPSVRR